jgi:acetolactate synthase-1/2/3 large subunit
MRKGAKCVIDAIADAGVKTVFGLPGGTVLDIFSELYNAPFEFVLVRHEQGAAHMADGYARATGKTGCCIVTSGPGATNTVTGLATANMDGIPVVCISGQVPSSMIGNDAFQEADTIGITRAVTKHNYLVKRVDDIPDIIAEAFHIAQSGRPGPVLVDIPKDIQQQQTDAIASDKVQRRGLKPVYEPDPKQINALIKAISNSRKPVILAGGGVISGSASAELTAFARKAKIPVTTTLMGIGGFPDTDPLALRMPGMHGSVAANQAISECDLIISIGARYDDRVTGKVSRFAPYATKAHVDIDPSAISKSVPIDIPVIGHVKPVLKELTHLVETVDRKEWLAQCKKWTSEFPFSYDKESTDLLPQFVIDKIGEVTKGDAIIVTDVGQHQMWAAHFYDYTKPRTFITSGGLGTMGFGLPAAIGVQSAFRDRKVVTITGDGSIQMNFQELVVAVEHDLPIIVVILNNGYLGMVRQWQEMFYKKEYAAVRLGQDMRGKVERIKSKPPVYLPDFVKLAEAHGAVGMRVTKKSEVTSALKKAIAMHRPVVVECIVKPDENVYPMVPVGAALNEMLLRMI